MQGQAAVELVVESIGLAMRGGGGGENGNKTGDGVLSKRFWRK